MTKPHKWAKEIKEWADGAEIEQIFQGTEWEQFSGFWDMDERYKYRIKPHRKENLCKHGLQRGKCTLGEKDCNESQYLYALKSHHHDGAFLSVVPNSEHGTLIGKIKLETGNDI